MTASKLIRESKTKIKRYLQFIAVIICSMLIFTPSALEELDSILIENLNITIPTTSEILLLKIDEKTLSELGPLPLSRAKYAQAIELLNAEGVDVIGINELFINSSTEDEQLQSAIQSFENTVVLGSKFVEGEVIEGNFRSPNANYGYTNLIDEQSNGISTVDLSSDTSTGCEYSFSTEVVSRYLGLLNKGCLSGIPVSREVTLPNRYNFLPPRDNFNAISFADLYAKRVDISALNPSIVLIGSTIKNSDAQSYATLLNSDRVGQSNIELQATIINSLINQNYLKDISPYLFVGISIAVASILYYSLRKFSNSTVRALIFGVLFLCIAQISFTLLRHGINWPTLPFLLILLVAYLYIQFEHSLERYSDGIFLKGIFGQYVNNELLVRIIKQPEKVKLAGQNREMSVLFSDVRSFTTLSENIDSRMLIRILNEYLGLMSDIILESQGTIDKFIGDGIMAFWNAPLENRNHALNAIQAALKMSAALKEFNRNHKEYPNLKIGIGINTGQMNVGGLGSDKLFDYTVLGDNVNLGSRIEGLTKKYGVDILASASTVQAAQKSKESRDILFRPIDRVFVKGKRVPVLLYQPMKFTSANHKLYETYTAGFTHYQNMKFKLALKCFEKLPYDGPSRMLADRIRKMKFKSNWNGVWAWHQK